MVINNKKDNKQRKPIHNDQMIYSMGDLKEMGYSYYLIGKLVSEGKLNKLNSSFFENSNYSGEISDFFYVSAFVPRGVICLMSAARYYDLTTYWPEGVDVAIDRDSKVGKLPDIPQINIVFFSEKRFSSGVVTVKSGKNVFRIYDVEKTVVDVLFYRNKIGIEETKEILTNYLKREDRDLKKLHRYAKELRCGKILSTYLEVLV